MECWQIKWHYMDQGRGWGDCLTPKLDKPTVGWTSNPQTPPPNSFMGGRKWGQISGEVLAVTPKYLHHLQEEVPGDVHQEVCQQLIRATVLVGNLKLCAILKDQSTRVDNERLKDVIAYKKDRPTTTYSRKRQRLSLEPAMSTGRYDRAGQ